MLPSLFLPWHSILRKVRLKSKRHRVKLLLKVLLIVLIELWSRLSVTNTSTCYLTANYLSWVIDLVIVVIVLLRLKCIWSMPAASLASSSTISLVMVRPSPSVLLLLLNKHLLIVRILRQVKLLLLHHVGRWVINDLLWWSNILLLLLLLTNSREVSLMTVIPLELL